MNPYWRQLVKRFHPEGIPWPGSIIYNTVSRTDIFLHHYDLVAHEITGYGQPLSILDIGTGPGHLLLAMNKVLPNSRLIGIDISLVMVRQAKRNLDKHKPNRNIRVCNAGAALLPFADKTFDCVVSTGSLHHWNDPIQAFNEIYRVLKAGGHALIYDLVRCMPRALCREIRAQYGSFRLALLWLHSFEEPFLNAEEMEALGRKTGLLVEGTKFTGALCCLILKKDPMK